MNQYAVVTLNRYPRLAESLVKSIRKNSKTFPEMLIVQDRHNTPVEEDIFTVNADGPFCFARNANIGFDFFPLHDIVLVNDDIEIVEPDFFDKLRDAAYEHPRCGLIAPLVDGGVGNAYQSYGLVKYNWKDIPRSFGLKCEAKNYRIGQVICFTCVYIKRDLIEEIGPLDEDFVDYGFDDNDYCVRANMAGYWTMICNTLRVKHGMGGTHNDRGINWSGSFARETDLKSNEEKFKKKYNLA